MFDFKNTKRIRNAIIGFELGKQADSNKVFIIVSNVLISKHERLVYADVTINHYLDGHSEAYLMCTYPFMLIDKLIGVEA